MIKLNSKIFREYDVRGTVDVDLSPEFAELLGKAYGELARESGKRSISIGRDCRHTSKPYAESLARGIASQGVNCTHIGMGPTPMTYWTLFNMDFDGCIQVTGSHNPSNMNGFKICLGKNSIFGEKIQDLYQRCEKLNKVDNYTGEAGSISEINVINDYIQNLTENSKPHMGTRKLKIVCDAGNGVGGMVGPKLLKNLGIEVIELFCEPDGDFPNHHPDPTVLDNIQELISKVKETKADFGIGWDGDGDRIGAVDENGNVIFGDMLMVLYSRSLLKKVPKATVIADVKCSSRLFEDIEKNGGKAIMCQTGHSLVKSKLKEENAELAGEMSGHIFFKHRFFGFDDALYCSARLAEIVSNTDKAISTLLDGIPKMISTPEIRVDCPEEIKFLIAKKAQTSFSEYEVSTIDGVRIKFENGWGLVRASNTQPVLVMRFEADSEENLEKYKNIVSTKIEEIKVSLEVS